jgi:hypothetical protein
MTTEINVLRKLRARAPGMGLLRDFYTDDAIYRHREWLFAAHTAEFNSCRHGGSRLEFDRRQFGLNPAHCQFVDWYCCRLAARFETEELIDVA